MYFHTFGILRFTFLMTLVLPRCLSNFLFYMNIKIQNFSCKLHTELTTNVTNIIESRLP